MLAIILILAFTHIKLSILHEIRVANIQLSHDSKYIPAYHLHTIGIFPINTLHDCIYLCHDNDYCRTATYFDSTSDTMCSLFEENSFVGRIVSMTTTMSIVISFNLCPNGFSEPQHICFGLPESIQPPVTVQYALDNLRFTQTWVLRTYYPIIFPTRFYLPSFTSGVVQIFDWPSLTLISNMTFPFTIYSFDMNFLGSFLLTSRTTYDMYYYTTLQNWTDSSANFYPAYLSDDYLVALTNGGSKIYVRNVTTNQPLFNITIANTTNWWARILNQQLYVTSSNGLRRIDLTQGVSATPVLLMSNFSSKELFLDASSRLYIEQDNPTKNNSFVYDIQGNLLAKYTLGSKVIGRASKYTFYMLNNYGYALSFCQYP
ncbi:hypothetical protein I4U23_006459 [Adineta vaga]|nr:hypothetical protein I4U23_006459 [Adineta vaga]